MRGDAGRFTLSAARAAERLGRLPIFTVRDYLSANPDVAQTGVDPVKHALENGIAEGRTLFSDAALARAYGRAAERGRHPFHPENRVRRGLAQGGRRCSVFVHSLSDDAYRELARDLAADLAGVGFDVAVADERADPLADHGIAVFVAPHDFFALGLGPLWAETGLIGESLVVIDDAPESIEGGRSLGWLLAAGGVIDASAVGAGIWPEAGIPTFRLEPRIPLRNRWLEAADLDHPLMLAAPERARTLACDPLDWGERPLDLLFFSRESPRRNAALGRLAAWLAPHCCFVYAQQGVASKAEERLHRAAHWRVSGHLNTQARLTLHIGEGRFPALERRRIVLQAMAGGSAVVSAVRFVEPGLESGVHYLHDDVRHLGALIDWLIVDPDGHRAAERVRERAFDRIAAVNRDRRRAAGLDAFLLGAGGSAGGAP